MIKWGLNQWKDIFIPHFSGRNNEFRQYIDRIHINTVSKLTETLILEGIFSQDVIKNIKIILNPPVWPQ